ncbi:MAG: autotransporter outer membrane beta-barrel domain-containing protein [Synechococcus sp. MIT S9220]|uniref:autotransporter outer membrane beta-barrel domain-containing protein n=1 Tax=unclassified Synechococcus TaxID=2626047 RepID=UPI00164B351C|nr:autotransporter outer membrane beta-barrel domain-containing protein [Synechococcus sp. MIT S9220]NOL47496.1 autotransporter outer membrane beta-barrel domain-containing protein [Synechococcus sp. MIT S9220]
MNKTVTVNTASLSLGLVLSFAGCLSLSAKAANYFQIIEYDGKEYCVKSGTGSYYFAGTNVDAANLNPPNNTTNGRALYSEVIPTNTATNNKGTQGAVTNKNHWSAASSAVSPWGFAEYQTGNKNKFAQSVSEQIPNLRVASGVGGSNRLRGYFEGIYQDHVSDNLVKEYKVKNTAFVVGMSNCVDDEGSDDIGEIIVELNSEDPSLVDALMDKLAGSSVAERRELLGDATSSLLIPRNVIAAGGLVTQAFSNDLADTILERLPTRSLVEVDEVVVETEEVEEENDPSVEPVRGLWMKDGELDDQEASAYLDDTLIASTERLEVGGISYVEDADPRSVFLDDGMRAWVRSFAGSMSPFRTGGLEKNGIYYPGVYNDFYSTHGGVIVGVDAPVADKLQLGVFGHYGRISLNQFAGENTGKGSWNPSGLGGGFSASYVDQGFYVQGLFGATAFSGDNKRQVFLSGVIDETYTATKNTTSFVGALRVGAPLMWGNAIVEPQLTIIWNGNNDSAYTEKGRYDALALKLDSYSDNFLRTSLGSKFAWPIAYDNGNMFTPSVRVAWLADWNTGNGDVSYKRANTDNPVTAKIPSNQEMENGVLLEAGVDYSIFSSESSSWMIYGKGGAKIWFNKSPDWRASGGLTFRF